MRINGENNDDKNKKIKAVYGSFNQTKQMFTGDTVEQHRECSP